MLRFFMVYGLTVLVTVMVLLFGGLFFHVIGDSFPFGALVALSGVGVMYIYDTLNRIMK